MIWIFAGLYLMIGFALLIAVFEDEMLRIYSAATILIGFTCVIAFWPCIFIAAILMGRRRD